MSQFLLPRSTELVRIQLKGLLFTLFNLFQRKYTSVVLTTNGIILNTRVSHRYNFEDFSEEVSIRKVLGFTYLVFLRSDGSKIKIGPIDNKEATTFQHKTNKERQNYFEAIIEAERTEITTLCRIFDSLKNPRRYPSACLLKPFIERSQKLITKLPHNITLRLYDHRKNLSKIKKLAENPSKLREDAIRTFVNSKLDTKSEFFDTIEKHPLTHEQRLAIITEEDALLVLAGAGSGKTSVITTKVIYLLQEQICKPEEILLITYSRKAAKEIKERIRRKVKVDLKVATFHSLGLNILKEAEARPPALAQHASDNKKFRKLIQTILVEEVAKQPGMESILRNWFEEFYLPYKSEWDFNSLNEYYEYINSINHYFKSKKELRTLKGDKVRSFEEMKIANWLYINGIEYEYEPIYQFKLPQDQKNIYRPDFRLVSSGVYIEHFGLRKEFQNGTEKFTTAPYIDCSDYLEQRNWKLKTHKENQTILIETFSYEQTEGVLLENLAKKLEPYETPSPIPTNQMFESLHELGAIDQFSNILATFLRLYKSSSLSIKDCQVKVNNSNFRNRGTAFLKIFEPLVNSYEEKLEGQIDFEDMIFQATKYLREGIYKSPYRQILIDEFQDMTQACGQLLRELKKQHEDVRIFGVGDDWQSIYRFNGSDIHLMRNFSQIFGGKYEGMMEVHNLIDLAKTFRSVDKIAKSAQNFIQKNPYQIKKQITPSNFTDKSSIFIIYHPNHQKDLALREALDRLAKCSTEIKPDTVFMLARYNHQIPDNFDDLQRNYTNLHMEFLTIHGSKGLEADHVILLNASSGQWGFPSEIIDDPLLNIVLPESEDYIHAEERRLFYVAMTRARVSFTMLSAQNNPSCFVRELEKSDPGIDVTKKSIFANKPYENVKGVCILQ